MGLPFHVVDAFTDRPFFGNPAAVCILEAPCDERWMQSVAREMNLSETAFLHPIEGGWALRWWTPTVEVKLCGHATLASAHALWETSAVGKLDAIHFHTLSGWLTCRRVGDAIEMDFPKAECAACEPPAGLVDALGCDVLECGSNGMDFLAEIADETTLRSLAPNFSALAKIPARGVVVTCRSASPDFDFVSRFFGPAAGVNEDPVTGSAHCALGPHWQAKLGKNDFVARQLSARGGVVRVGVRGERVLLAGHAVTVSRGEFLPPQGALALA